MAATAPTRERLLTIGTVCRRLKPEFPDISISKIRYLEDQGLLMPKRTQGGYRLFGEDDVERLETILRLQRDGRWMIEDAGSLNGTFVNRKRVESAALDDGDEIQIGKYRLTFLTR